MRRIIDISLSVDNRETGNMKFIFDDGSTIKFSLEWWKIKSFSAIMDIFYGICVDFTKGGEKHVREKENT